MWGYDGLEKVGIKTKFIEDAKGEEFSVEILKFRVYSNEVIFYSLVFGEPETKVFVLFENGVFHNLIGVMMWFGETYKGTFLFVYLHVKGF